MTVIGSMGLGLEYSWFRASKIPLSFSRKALRGIFILRIDQNGKNGEI